MRIFLYEFVTGGGFLSSGEAFPASLLQEGMAMTAALASDLAAIDRAAVVTLRDHRMPDFVPSAVESIVIGNSQRGDAAFEQQARAADWTIVIAPEMEGALERYCRRVLDVGGRLLGPGPDLVALCSDKQRLADHLLRHNVPAPGGRLLHRDDAWPLQLDYPLVLKPFDGAGSWETFLLSSTADGDPRSQCESSTFRLEDYVPGIPASVSFLCGPTGCQALRPSQQLLSDDGRFTYKGGRLLTEQPLIDRAVHLAMRAIQSTPAPVGYLGVDLVLGHAPTGADDRVIEINARMTTSYVGLRAATQQNLAQAMLTIAGGNAVPVVFDRRPIAFTAAGTVS